MEKSVNPKKSNAESNKDYELCINFENCKNKWYRYRNKEDNGYCKACIKNQILKDKGIKINKYRNLIYDCKTEGCEKNLILQKTDYCKALYCRKCFD